MIARVVKVAAAVGACLSFWALMVMAALSLVTTFTAAAWLVVAASAFTAGVSVTLLIALSTPNMRPGWWWHR